jgi:hypothetical protein
MVCSPMSRQEEEIVTHNSNRMYAIPPSIQSEGFIFSSQHMSPFMLTKKRRQTSVQARECFFSNSFLGLAVLEQGTVTSATPLGEILQQLRLVLDSISHAYMSSGGRQGYLKDCYRSSSTIVQAFPGLLYRLAYDAIDPFRDLNLLALLFRCFDRSNRNHGLLETHPECCFWFTIITLCFIESRAVMEIADPFSREVVRRSAQNIQSTCEKLDSQSWQILQWKRQHDDPRYSSSSSSKMGDMRLAAYCGNFSAHGHSIWSVQTQRSTNSLLFVADDSNPGGHRHV